MGLGKTTQPNKNFKIFKTSKFSKIHAFTTSRIAFTARNRYWNKVLAPFVILTCEEGRPKTLCILNNLFILREQLPLDFLTIV